jgi:(2S)-methylsuccinyl-CoA dehydrogenase
LSQCTFGARADVFMLLARTDPDRSKGHKGLSLFVVPKERGSGHGFELSQEEGGSMEGRAIDTIGYRGMHSYEVAFDNWYVPAESLIGGEEGLGRGFYMQMAGFENGRIQTAARRGRDAGCIRGRLRLRVGAQRLRQADRRVPAHPRQAGSDGGDHPGQPPVRLPRRPSDGAGRGGDGGLDGQGLRLPSRRVGDPRGDAVHGGMGYAEEFPVSRYYVDARVLSIFEGADEILALKVIARRLAR